MVTSALGSSLDSAQRDLLQAFARQASLALGRARLIDQQSRLVATLLERQRESLALVNALTHDLEAPLTVIRGHAEIAGDNVDKGRYRLSATT